MGCYIVKKQRVKKMKKTIKLFVGMFLISIVYIIISISLAYAITSGCGDEVDINTACVIRTPPLACSTFFDLYNSSNELISNGTIMEEIVAGSGVYNFTFQPNASGIHTIVLCDNTSTQINVETTDETDLGTILSNQATLQDNIETVNDTIKEINLSIIVNLSNDDGFYGPQFSTITNNIETVNETIKTVNNSIIANLSNDDGFFIPLFQVFNISIIDHIRNNITAAVGDINLNITGTDFASNVWAYLGTITNNILTQISNSTFRRTIQNSTVVPLVNESTGIIVNETLRYADGSEVITTFKYNESTFMILNSSSTRDD